MGVSMSWYIDSWAVRDGLAFASYRPANNMSRAERTVFISVPGLDAVPVGRVSTALWATRANFQRGLHTEEGEEIGFTTLQTVRELVRRGYLAGGIGPGPVGEEGPEPPGRPPDDALAHRQLEQNIQRLVENSASLAELSGIAGPQTRAQLFNKLSDPEAVEQLFEYLRVFGEASTDLWTEQIEAGSDTDAATGEFLAWLQLLYMSGIWSSSRQLLPALDRLTTLHRLPDLDDWFYQAVHFGAWPRFGEVLIDEQIVFRVPCPLRPGWDRRIRRLSDKLLLAISTHDYFDSNPQLPEFIPALLAALIIVTQASGPFVSTPSRTRVQRLKAALEWLSQQMPQVQLPPAAEDALTRFAWSELSRRD
jgi:hypothetical protein